MFARKMIYKTESKERTMRRRQQYGPVDADELTARLLEYQQYQRRDIITPSSETALATPLPQHDQLQTNIISSIGKIVFLLLVLHLTTNRSRLFQGCI